MKYVLVLLILIISTPTVFAVKTGFCTGIYLETGPNHIPGLIQQGDVFEYWCELPQPARERLTVEVRYPNGQHTLTVTIPRLLLSPLVVVYP